MSLLATTLCLLSGLGCTDEEVTGPRAAGPKTGASNVVASDSLWATLQFKLTGNSAQTTFPVQSSCTSGLVLTPGAPRASAETRNMELGTSLPQHISHPFRQRAGGEGFLEKGGIGE